MFSFHKPKIYRSLNGCCICRAKSSSSRFTDSKRYEIDFEKCFQIYEHRAGEICNACVLLVKRWKKLPAGSNRNWNHVVDARAGPGTKSMYKIKNRSKEDRQEPATILKKKHKHKHKHKKGAKSGQSVNKPPQSPSGFSDDVNIGDEGYSDNYNSRTPSPDNSDVSDDESERPTVPQPVSRRRKQSAPSRFSSFLDLNYWKKTEICCGIIFKGQNGEVMVDTALLRPCTSCRRTQSSTSLPTRTRRQNSESCASSDSGVITPRNCLPHPEESMDSTLTLVDDDDVEDDDDMMDDVDDDDVGRNTPSPPTLLPETPAVCPRSMDYCQLEDPRPSEAEPAPFMPAAQGYKLLNGAMCANRPASPSDLASTVEAAASAVLDLSRSSRKVSANPPNLCIPLEV